MGSIIWSHLAHFLSPSLRKIKKIHPEKNSLHLGKRNFLALILRNFLYFLKRKLFLYFRKRKPRKIPYISGNGTFLYFLKTNFSYISGKVYLEPWHI